MTWQDLRDDNSRLVEAVLRKKFQQVDAYSKNSCVMYVRVVDARFKGLKHADRLVRACLHEIPDDARENIVSILTLTPEGVEASKHIPSEYAREAIQNLNFENPRA